MNVNNIVPLKLKKLRIKTKFVPGFLKIFSKILKDLIISLSIFTKFMILYKLFYINIFVSLKLKKLHVVTKFLSGFFTNILKL